MKIEKPHSEGMDANDGFEEDIPMIGIGVEVPEHAVDVYQPVAAYEELSDDDEHIAAPLPVALEYPMDVEHEIELNDEDQGGNRSPEPQDVEQPGTQNFLAEDSEDIDSASTCTICYSPYTNSGEHRLCCLKCGHLFGKSCITRWLKAVCSVSGRKCPSCNVKANCRDIRVLYAKTLIALDTTERDRLMNQLQTMETEKNRLDSLLRHSNSKIHKLQEQVDELENKIKELSENPRLHEQADGGQRNNTITMKIMSSFKLSDRGCRVLASSEHLSLLLASQESTNQLFPGFGIRKINTYDMKPAPYQNHLHKKEIRDMAFSSHDRGTLLTVSLDCTAKIFDVQSNVAVHTLTVPEPLWSCSWNSLDSNKFLCGGQKSTIFVFDRRFLSGEPEKTIQLPESKTGIISLTVIPPRAGRFMPNGGILACRLTSVTAVYHVNDGIESTVLPIEGNFLSMRYDHFMDNLLFSTRPSKNYATPRHIVGQLSKSVHGDPKNGLIDVIHTFHGARSPKVLCRSALFSYTNGDQIVCAYNERDSTLDSWSLMSDTKLNTREIYLPDPILDICAFRSQDSMIVPCLSESKLSVIKVSDDP